MRHVVMIIDDSPLERLVTETLVKRSLPADQVVSFSSGFGGLERLQQIIAEAGQFPEVIILDIYMPVMNGFDFLDKYLEFPIALRERCKVVMFSSTENAEDHARMRTYPVICKFLGKPLSVEMIDEMSSYWEDSKIAK